MTSSHDRLLDALVANPDDLAPWSVYGDLLQTQSDPRGELVTMMLEREQNPSQRLFETERRYLGKHAARLLPHDLVLSAGTLPWRRGFVAELRITDPEELATAHAEPTLRFVDAATLVIDGTAWDEWCEQLEARQLPWRRLRIELEVCPEEVELRRVLAGFPALEMLRIACPRDEAPPFVWDGVDARRLERIVLVHAGELGTLDTAELPALRELRLFGQSTASDELRHSLRWSRLETVVLSDEDVAEDADDADAEHGPFVRVAAPIERDVDAESNAFIVIGQPVDLALLEKLVARLSGIAELSARIATVECRPQPVTVIQLYGRADADLPYGLAVALERVVTPAPRIALVEVDEYRGRFLVLGTPEVRDELHDPDQITRRAIDLALGRDPGFGILDDICDELAVAPAHVLIGVGPHRDTLHVIDPTAEPLIEPLDDDDDYEEDRDVLDLDDEDEDEYTYAYEDDVHPSELPSEDPAPVFVQLAAELDHDDGLDGFADDDEDEDDPFEPTEHAAFDHPEVWFAFRDHWDDRAIDPDDEPAELRWPDPEHREMSDADIERQTAAPACAKHGRELDTCTWCAAPLCVECEHTEDGCAVCVAELDRPLPPCVPPRPIDHVHVTS